MAEVFDQDIKDIKDKKDGNGWKFNGYDFYSYICIVQSFLSIANKLLYRIFSISLFLVNDFDLIISLSRYPDFHNICEHSK